MQKATNSEIIDCECGNQYSFGNRHRHLQSTKHTDYQDKLCGIIKEQVLVIEDKISKEEKNNITKQKQKEYRMKNAEKIKEIEYEYSRTQKNKATEYHLGTLKAKLAMLRR